MRPEQPLTGMSEEGRVSWRRRGECCAAFIPAVTPKMGAEAGKVSGEDGGDETGSVQPFQWVLGFTGVDVFVRECRAFWNR